MDVFQLELRRVVSDQLQQSPGGQRRPLSTETGHHLHGTHEVLALLSVQDLNRFQDGVGDLQSPFPFQHCACRSNQ